MELSPRIAPWFMLLLTIVVAAGCYEVAQQSMAKAVVLGLSGIGLQFIIRWHVYDNLNWSAENE